MDRLDYKNAYTSSPVWDVSCTFPSVFVYAYKKVSDAVLYQEENEERGEA